MFRAGDRYVSTASVDADTGKIVMRGHPAADYIRIELRVGEKLPDFEFTDLDGMRRTTAVLRGKYVLVDFWATWCGPCVGEIPNLISVYKTNQPRGLEILGVSGDETADVVKAFAKERGVAWPQATPESTSDLVKHRLRIGSWPTTIMLDPEGRVVSLGGPDLPLRGDMLSKSLDRILAPRAPEGMSTTPEAPSPRLSAATRVVPPAH